LVGPVIEAEMRGSMLADSAPRLAPSEEGGLARLRGAAALVLQRHSGKRHGRDVPVRGRAAKVAGRKRAMK
jgi:hypothetical protein